MDDVQHSEAPKTSLTNWPLPQGDRQMQKDRKIQEKPVIDPSLAHIPETTLRSHNPNLPVDVIDGGNDNSFHRLSSMRRSRPTSGISRAASPISRLSNRMSQVSDSLYEGLEFQGWGETSPTWMEGGLWRMENLESAYRASRSLENATRLASSEEQQDNSHWHDVTGSGGREAKQVSTEKHRYGFSVWATMFALSITQLLNAFEGTVTSTALPTIVHELGGGASFVWVSTGYFLTSTIFQPLFGQTADIFGRKPPILFAVAMFVIGSGISGGALSMGSLILGRIFQGIGGGGINVLVNTIVCDMFPLRERGKFLAIVMAAISVGTSIGPILGGVIVQHSTWRWVFYLNLPVGGVSLLLLFAFLKKNTITKDNSKGIKQRLGMIDYGGNVLLIIGVTLILLTLAYGGTTWAWNSYSAIMSLCLGFFILVVFVFYEDSNYCKKPTLPLRLFRNRTSASAYAVTFLQSLLTMQTMYFLPVYFQAVMLSTPTITGVQMLPTVLILVPSSVLAGILLSKTGRYKPLHIAGFALLVIGFGCFTLLKHSSSTAVWIVLQLVTASGSGFTLSTLLPAAQACLQDADTASATAAWAFLRSFGIVWGFAVPSAIFDGQASKLAQSGLINDENTAAMLSTGGAAYSHATADWVGSLAAGDLRDDVITLYERSLRVVWIFAVALAGLAFILMFFEKEVVLRQKVEKTDDSQDT